MAESSKTSAFATFDVIKLAREILSEVDAVRGYSEEVNPNTGKGYTVPSESRLNAFFRLIGLPMFVNLSLKQDAKPAKNLEGDRYITPGFDKHFQFKLADYQLQNSDKDGFGTRLGFREGLLKSSEASIGTPDTNRAMTLALTSPIPLAPEITNNGYPTSIGKTPDSQRDVYKSLFPMISSYLDVTPKNHQTARPFLPDSRRSIIGRDQLSKPFLETVARIRLSLGAGNIEDDNRKSAFNSVIAQRVGQDYANILLKNLGQTNILEELIISRMIASVEQLAKRWVKIRTEQERISRDLPYTIRIKSNSAKDSPLGKRMSISADVEIKKDHYLGKRMDTLQRGISRFESVISLLPTDESANPTATGAPQSKNTQKSALINPFISLLNSELSSYRQHEAKLNKQIAEEQQKADKLRLEVEMMTGEFTGLSIPDVVATIIGLFLISQNDLIALFDADVRNDMSKSRDSSLTSAIERAGTITNESTKSAIENLQKQVQNVFNLMNNQVKLEINKNERQRNQVGNQNKPQKKDKPKKVNRQERAEKLANEAKGD